MSICNALSDWMPVCDACLFDDFVYHYWYGHFYMTVFGNYFIWLCLVSSNAGFCVVTYSLHILAKGGRDEQVGTDQQVETDEQVGLMNGAFV